MSKVKTARECDCGTCTGGESKPGHYGGWHCACPCHNKKKKESKLLTEKEQWNLDNASKKRHIDYPAKSAHGQYLQQGNVVRKIKGDKQDRVTGIIMRTLKPGDKGNVFQMVGDIEIYISQGVTRITNKYSEWEHVPKEEQTFFQRYMSWLYTPGEKPEYEEHMSDDEWMCYRGIVDILPEETVDWDNNPPSNFTEVFRILAQYMDTLKDKPPKSEDIKENPNGLIALGKIKED